MYYLFIGLVAVAIINSCLSVPNLDELKQQYVGIMMECSKEYTWTPEEIDMLQKKQMPEKESVKCIFACSLKKAKLMDESGMLSVDGLNSMIEKYFADDPAKKQKAMQFTEACKSVNDESVTDGDKGCDRAALIYKCSVEKAPEFDLLV